MNSCSNAMAHPTLYFCCAISKFQDNELTVEWPFRSSDPTPLEFSSSFQLTNFATPPEMMNVMRQGNIQEC